MASSKEVLQALRKIEDAREDLKRYEIGRLVLGGLAALGLLMLLAGVAAAILGLPLGGGGYTALFLTGATVHVGGLIAATGWRSAYWYEEKEEAGRRYTDGTQVVSRVDTGGPYKVLKRVEREYEDLLADD